MRVVRRIFISLVVAAFAISVSSSLILATEGSDDSGESRKLNSAGVDLKDKKAEFSEKKLELKNKKEEIREKKDELKEREASKRAELKEKKLDLVKKRFTYLSRHLNAYLLRLDKISDKVSKRITKLNAQGVDTSKGQAKLDEAKLLRGLAKTAVDKAIVDAQSVVGAADIKAATDTAVASIKDAKTALFNYHKKLVEATKELKASRELREGTGSAEKD